MPGIGESFIILVILLPFVIALILLRRSRRPKE
jgi:hypothetical protein